MKNQNSEVETSYMERIYGFKSVIVVLFYGILALIALRIFIFQGGTIGHNWDWSIPPLPEQLRYMSQQSFQIWRDTSFGNPSASQLNYAPLNFFIGGFGYLGLYGGFVSNFLIFIVILISGVSMFYLVQNILEHETKPVNKSNTFFSPLIAGYFYALSPFIFSEFIGGSWTQFLAYSFIPGVIYFYRKIKIRGTVKLWDVFIATIFLSLISISFNAVILIVLILLLYTVFLGNKHMAKGLLLSFLFFVPLNFYWLVPSLSEFWSGTSLLSTSNSLYLPTLFNAVPSLHEIFVGAGYYRPFYVWVLDGTILPIWSVVTFSFLLCVLVALLLFRKTREAFFWIILYTVSLAVATVGQSPISGPILWLYQNISLMALYRSPQHLIILTIVPLAIILGLGTSAIISLSQKKMTQISSIRRRKTLVATIIIIIFLGMSIWVSPFFTGNLGADYLRSKGGGNFVDTYNLSPDLVTALGEINSDNDSGAFRTLFLPPSNSPYYLKTTYQQEGQGGDVVIGDTPRGIGDAYDSYSEPIVTFIRDSFIEGTFKYPWLLEIANIKYIILRNDVIPNFGSNANLWNFTRTYSTLKDIAGLRLIYEGQHVSLWEYENFRPLIYATKNLITVPSEHQVLPFSLTTEPINHQVLDDFENSSTLNWFTSKNFEQNLTFASSYVAFGNSSLQASYNKLYRQGAGNLNYVIKNERNIYGYLWVSVRLYYPGVPPPDSYVELYLYNNTWGALDKQSTSVTTSGWNNLLFGLTTQNLTTARFFKLQFYDNDFVNETTTIALDNIDFLSISKENYNILFTNPTIHFQEVNPTTYRVNVTNATEPFYLIFSETYDSSWKIYEGSVNWLETIFNEPLSAEHFYVNGYANAWYINKTGTFTITLEFWPQNLFYAGSVTSITTLIFCIIYVNKDKIKIMFQKIARNKISRNQVPS
jgi:hypothetical protein